jgi:hypothetical protein
MLRTWSLAPNAVRTGRMVVSVTSASARVVLAPAVLKYARSHSRSSGIVRASNTSSCEVVRHVTTSESLRGSGLKPGTIHVKQQTRRCLHTPTAGQQLQRDSWAVLPSRGVLQVQGPDCITFLQGNTHSPLRKGQRAILDASGGRDVPPFHAVVLQGG